MIGDESESHEQAEEVDQLRPLIGEVVDDIEVREREPRRHDERQSDPGYFQRPLVEDDDPGQDQAEQDEFERDADDEWRDGSVRAFHDRG